VTRIGREQLAVNALAQSVRARGDLQQLEPCMSLLAPPAQLGTEGLADLGGLPVVGVVRHQPKTSQALTKQSQLELVIRRDRIESAADPSDHFDQ
jgi:hypothetical protein